MAQSPVPIKPGIQAMLGPTNTGKTHYAIERLIRARSGIIGLPLRLLAREVYDRIKTRVHTDSVALVTGEEKIIPEHARYFVCTVESMPRNRGVEFVAVDEIQLCADPDRGHVFTDRLLHTRGIVETVFLGSASMTDRLRELVPEATVTEKPRFSRLSYAGRARLDRLPPRSAIVAFSADEVYAIAETVRRRKGGAAVVLGALSPRTRNAQVELFQSGEVDTIVATDAIGMGLNLDIDHVAFAGLVKFDGRVRRELAVEELAQIAGRAGRHRNHGTFGVTNDVDNIPARTFQTIETHRMPPITTLRWRNANLDFSTLGALLASLNSRPAYPNLVWPREAADSRALQILAEQEDIVNRTTTEAAVRQLWEACRLPDYPKVSPGHHAGIIGEIYGFLTSAHGTIPDEWMARNLNRVAPTSGTIASLSDNLAHARTWQYIANQSAWLDDANHWQEQTRYVEDQISDALHEKLVAQFIDRRATTIAKQQRAKTSMGVALQADGTIVSDGVSIAVLDGFRFRTSGDTNIPLSKPERTARNAVAETAIARRAAQFANCADKELDFLPPTQVGWNGAPVAQLRPGPELMRPELRILTEDAAHPRDIRRIEQRIQAWLKYQLHATFAPLMAMQNDPDISGLGKGIGFRLMQGLGILPRALAQDDVAKLSQAERAPLRKHGVRFGRYNIFVRPLIKPAPARLRLILWGLANNNHEVDPPPPSLNHIPRDPQRPDEYYVMSGFHPCGTLAVRVDILERLHEIISVVDAGDGFESNLDMLSVLGCSVTELQEVLESLNYKVVPKARPTPEGSSTDSQNPVLFCQRKARRRSEHVAKRRAKIRPTAHSKSRAFKGKPRAHQPDRAQVDSSPAAAKPFAELANLLQRQTTPDT